MNKEEPIRRITDINSLTAIVSQLAEKSGLNDVNKVANNVISSIESGAFKKRKNIFICTLSELITRVPQILNDVKNNSTIEDDVIIVTSNKKKITNFSF